MAADNQILIIPVGLPELEVRLLTSMFLLTKSRQRNYAFANDNPAKADILLVNADMEVALAHGRKIQSVNPKIVTVYVSQHPASDSQHYHLQRRLTVPKVLQLLDQIALTELHMVASVSIGEGTDTANLSLEKKWVDEARLHHTLDNPQATASREGRRQKVLVVDDSPTVRKQIELGLLPYRVAIDLAETGEQALEFIAKQSNHQTYDLVFLDVVLPGTDGYEVCKNIKRQPLTKKTPVVMLTSKSSPFDRVRGTLAGCDSYLTKPVENKTFQDILQKYLTTPSKQGVVDNAQVKQAYPGFFNTNASI